MERMAEGYPLRLYFFGRFRLKRDGQPLVLPTRKLELLLAYLCLHPQRHNREKVAAAVWGDFTDDKARASLRNGLAVLRRLVHPNLILSDRETVQLNPDVPLWVDALVFAERARQFLLTALPSVATLPFDLVQGDLLADFYEEWLFPYREQTRQLYQTTLLRSVELLEAQGAYHSAIRQAQQLLTQEPTHEPAHQHLMICYERLGDRQAVIRQYETCRRVLAEELGVDPTPETRALYRRILTAAAPPATSLHTNLPSPLTPFIGRETETAHLSQQLSLTRLLTLTGPGGAGKTRLAIQIGQQKGAAFADGIWWVELAALTNPVMVAPTVLKVLGLREKSDVEPVTQLLENLRPRQTLLILDNCEHLILACAQLSDTLLLACPHLHILATSREALGLTGEVVWPVASLALDEAIKLFALRAAALKPTFTLTPETRPLVETICQQLDGNPLAIELAAARSKTLPLSDIVRRLDDRFALLTGGSRAALPRQQTLRAALDWSYDLLEPTEQTLFRQLSVFAGGFTLAAVEAVCKDIAGSVLDNLTRLVDKSLVMAMGHRYYLLATIRQYGLDKLWLAGEESDLRQRHLTWCTQLALRAAEQLLTNQQQTWLDELEVEHDNFRVALRWALEGGELETGIRLGSDLWRFWGYRGYLLEGRVWLEQMLSRLSLLGEAVRPAQAQALASMGVIATRLGDYDVADTVLQEGLRLYRGLGDKAGVAFVLHHLGWLNTAVKRFAAAHTCHQESLTFRRELGPVAQRDVAESLTYLGLLAWCEGDLATARAYQEEALTLKQAFNEPWAINFSLWNLGNVALAEGQRAEAERLYRQCLQALADLRERWGLPSVLESLGTIALAKQQWERVAILFAAAEKIRTQTGSPLPLVWREERERTLVTVQTMMGETAFAAATLQGQTLPLDKIISLALENE